MSPRLSPTVVSVGKLLLTIPMGSFDKSEIVSLQFQHWKNIKRNIVFAEMIIETLSVQNIYCLGVCTSPVQSLWCSGFLIALRQPQPGASRLTASYSIFEVLCF